MNKNLFQNLDLNLLRTLLILSQEQNMRRAAERLFVTQPAVSHALQKLRHHFNDELFTKVPQGLMPTPYAQSLCETLSPLLEQVESAVNQQVTFDPAALCDTVRIAFPPQFIAAYGSALFFAVQKAAPNLRLELVEWNNDTLTELEQGRVQIAIQYDLDIRNPLTKKVIAPRRKGVVYVRDAHPLQSTSITPKDTIAYQWACLIVPGWTDDEAIISRVFEALNLPCSIAVRSTSIYTILDIVKHSDMLLPSNGRLIPPHQSGFRTLDVDFSESAAYYTINAYFHKKNQQHPLTLWLFDQLKAVITEMQ
uniref:LysR family transcriptional regulator n=1 Tax=Thaumasiovibrio occultus TaxID=1891184 RepID=UPI000B3539D4|nr:LysR family transcriptional regulator [Thaumasiovibrio occultus]